MSESTATNPRIWAANRLGLDYEAEAKRLGAPPVPIIDAHTHIHGGEAAKVYNRVRDLFGVELTYSMSRPHEVEQVRDALGGAVRFIAIPDYTSPDRVHAHTEGFLENIQWFAERGSRIVKFFAAPRGKDMSYEAGVEGLLDLDGPWRLRAMELAESLGMMFMAHVGDPDTWFATKYADVSRYGRKSDYYVAFERLLDRFTVPWMAAHMGGWPEDLDFLDGLLSRHPNLHLDTSATKWMVRELSKHPRSRLVEFLKKWRGRIIFGSDIVTVDEHLTDEPGPRDLGKQASGEQDAFALYASRYWALRTLWETDHEGESPIADPDLAMVDDSRFDAMSAPTLRGKALPRDLLVSLYRDAAVNVLEGWRDAHR